MPSGKEKQKKKAVRPRNTPKTSTPGSSAKVSRFPFSYSLTVVFQVFANVFLSICKVFVIDSFFTFTLIALYLHSPLVIGTRCNEHYIEVVCVAVAGDGCRGRFYSRCFCSFYWSFGWLFRRISWSSSSGTSAQDPGRLHALCLSLCVCTRTTGRGRSLGSSIID